MSRLTNNQIRQMNDHQKLDYAVVHPAESGRIAKITAQTAGQLYVMSAKHHTQQVVERVTGKQGDLATV